MRRLLASGPDPALADPLDLFGRFIGEWDLDVRFFDDRGDTVLHTDGVWEFGWILGGRAIQDVLTYDGTRTGTTVRYYQETTGLWLVYWLGATTGTTVFLRGGADGPGGEEILLVSDPEPDGTLNRWRFSAITADSFAWTGHESHDGTTWRLNQRMSATRRCPRSTPNT